MTEIAALQESIEHGKRICFIVALQESIKHWERICSIVDNAKEWEIDELMETEHIFVPAVIQYLERHNEGLGADSCALCQSYLRRISVNPFTICIDCPLLDTGKSCMEEGSHYQKVVSSSSLKEFRKNAKEMLYTLKELLFIRIHGVGK